MQHDAVAAAQRGADEAERAGPGRARRRRRRPRRPAGRSGGAGAAWAAAPARGVRTTRNGWRGVALGRAVVRRGEHDELVGRQPPPQLPQVRLDAADLGREVVGDEQVPHDRRRGAARRATVAVGRGRRRAPTPRARRSIGVGVRRAQRAQRGLARRVVAVADVAQHDERVAAQAARVAPGDVPAAVAGEQLVVGAAEQLEQRHPRLRVVAAVVAGAAGRRRATGWAGTPPGSRRSRRCGRRARRGTRRGNAPGACTSQARQRRASTTPGATMAPVGQPSRQRRHAPQPSATGAGRRRQRRVGDDRARARTTTAEPGQQQVGVLAVPAEPGPVGRLAVDEAVVVGEHHAPASRRPAARRRRRRSAVAQRRVVVDPGVARATRPRGPRRSAPAARRRGGTARAPTTRARAPGSGGAGSVDRAGLR